MQADKAAADAALEKEKERSADLERQLQATKAEAASSAAAQVCRQMLQSYVTCNMLAVAAVHDYLTLLPQRRAASSDHQEPSEELQACQVAACSTHSK